MKVCLSGLVAFSVCTRFARLIVGLVAVTLVSCAGGGGLSPNDAGAPQVDAGALQDDAGAPQGFGNSLPPSSGPGDLESFFPNAPGDSWNYFATSTNPSSGGPGSFMDSVKVTGTKTVDGVSASVFLESNPFGGAAPLEGYYFKNAGGVAFMGTNDATDKLTPALVPYLVGLFPLTPGPVAQYTKSGIDFGSDLDGDGINETVTVSVENSVVDFEALTIGIGSFPRTVKTTQSVTGAVVLSRNKASLPFSSATTRWLAPGVGILKSEQVATNQPNTGGTLVARGYTVNGAAHGFGPPSVVAMNLASGDSNLGNPGPPALATDGSHFLVVSESQGGLIANLLDANLVALNAQSLASASVPRAAFDGTNYWVVYQEGNSSLARRMSAAGNWVDTTDLTLVTPSDPTSTITSTAFAFGSSTGLLAYSQFDSSINQHLLFGVIAHPDGTASAPFPIAVDTSTHLNPSIAFDGTNFFVVWMQLVNAIARDGDLYGVRISSSGSVIDSAPIAISTAANIQTDPNVIFDGSRYLVVWGDTRNYTPIAGTISAADVYAARVSRGGLLIDGPPATGGFPVASGGTLIRFSPHVALLGAEYLVAWGCLGYANTGSQGIQAARLTTSATLPSGANMPIAVSGPPSASTGSELAYPTLAVGSQQGVIVWLDNREVVGSQKQLVGASVSPF
jgi:hypothetical protein